MKLNFLKSKKGIIMHPYTWVVAAFIIGLLVMFLIARDVVPLPGFLSFMKP